MINNFEQLIKSAGEQKKMRLAVASAQDEEVLTAICDAAKLGIAEPILVGDAMKIKQISAEHDLDISKFKIYDAAALSEAALKAVQLVSSGEADFVLKGLLDTSILLKAVLNKEVGLRTGSLLSHVMVYHTDKYHKFIFSTDGGMNIEPTLEEKVQVLRNAVKVVRSLGYETIKVACLAAKEKPDPKMKATMDAVMLKEMCSQGIFGEAVIVDGPLALDLAVSKEAARIKDFNSEVAGDADIFLMPSIEMGNGIGKALTLFGGAEQGGIIMGAKAPVVMVSRADSHEAKLNSIALGSLVSNYKGLKGDNI